jgi:hypothetical protein
MNGSGGDNRVYGVGQGCLQHRPQHLPLSLHLEGRPAPGQALRPGTPAAVGAAGRELQPLQPPERDRAGNDRLLYRAGQHIGHTAHAELPRRPGRWSKRYDLEFQQHSFRAAAERQRDQLLPRAAVPVWVEDEVLGARSAARILDAHSKADERRQRDRAKLIEELRGPEKLHPQPQAIQSARNKV